MSEPYAPYEPYDPYLPRDGSSSRIGEPVPGPSEGGLEPSEGSLELSRRGLGLSKVGLGPSEGVSGPSEGVSGPSEGGSNDGEKPLSKIEDVQAKVFEAKIIMEKNIRRVGEREERLEDLADKSGRLADAAGMFKKGANRVRKNMWWKDMKMRIIIGSAITVILIIIIVSVVKATHK